MYGIFGELISVLKSEYVLVVEVVFGGNYDNVVVEDDRVVEKVIKFFKEDRKSVV